MAEEFCYLNQRSHFYDWEIVPFHLKNPKNYMTISSRGITHFIQGEHRFISIEQWEHERRIFEKLIQIEFFKTY